MRIDVKKVKERNYVQYVNREGFLVHLGPADDVMVWKTAFHLLKDDLDYEMFRQFDKMKIIICESLGIKDQESYEKAYNEILTPYEGFGTEGLMGDYEYLKMGLEPPEKPHYPLLEKALNVLDKKRKKLEEDIKRLRELGI